ncbi:DUF2306 domain-containing protein [Parerythrobacter aurantius]|uniref:DUF2306 domain-containing protein n=1 Tax=Parerythrobacter aurantius TaxID=3127706 RepID=UPI00324CD432
MDQPDRRFIANTPSSSSSSADAWLSRAATACGWSIAAGQALFIAFILLFYYPTTLTGRFEQWNSKPLITGFQAGDTLGNAGFALHVTLAAVITFCGLLQLLSSLRRRWPAVHRWSGRTFIVTAIVLSLGGLWLVWVRGSYLTLVGAAGISVNAVVILACATMAWIRARERQFKLHREWALRLFVAASAVWFMRVGYMAWGLATGGVGIGDSMNGPFDFFLAFANTVVPLLVLEAYLRADGAGDRQKLATSALLALSALVILGGSAGAWLAMWGPYI